MDKRARLKKQMDFIIEVDKVKNIVRQTYLADGKSRLDFSVFNGGIIWIRERV